MIRFEQVSVTYTQASAPALADVDLTIAEGELCLLIGPSGSGKSTLLGAVSGLVPHFTGGTVHGRVTVDGRDTRTHRPRDLADLVGTVGQDPLAHFVTDTVEDELAYGMESLGLPGEVMRRRVEETLDLLSLAELRDRPLATLSGGQQQRVAIGSVLTVHPRVLVLDEPTSALDPGAAEEVLAVLQRLVHDLGTTVLLAEHRLERVIQYADRVILLPAAGRPPLIGEPAEIMASSPLHPPVVGLGRAAGWSPLPLSVRDARRRAAPLRARLAMATARHPAAGTPPIADPHGAGPHSPWTVAPGRGDRRPGRASVSGPPADDLTEPGSPGASAPVAGAPDEVLNPPVPGPGHGPTAPFRTQARYQGRPRNRPGPAGPAAAEVRALSVRRGPVPALASVNLTVRPAEAVALMGRNGAGKSTLLGALAGLYRPDGGGVLVNGHTPHTTKPNVLLRHVGLVPQEPRDLLYAETVAAECSAADRDAKAPLGTCRALVSWLLPDIPDVTHPRDLSEGQRLALALAVVLTAGPALLLLDEPTRGLDYPAKSRLVAIVRKLTRQGVAAVVATHDVEFAAELTDRVVVLADGEVVADGPTADVVLSSPAFAPQVAKILRPQPWLTVAEVTAALRELDSAKGPR